MKRIIKGVGTRHIEEVLAETGARKLNVECTLREAQIVQTANEAEANETRAQLDQATHDVCKAIDHELVAARKIGQLKIDRDGLSSQKLALRNQLLEAQKKIALLEVLAVSHAKLREIKQQQIVATKAAEEAKKFAMEHKRLQKEVAEATRRAQAGLNEQRPSKRPLAFRRGKSSKLLMRSLTYRVEEPSAKCPRRSGTYDTYEIDKPIQKDPTLANPIKDDVPLPASKHSECAADEVSPTLAQPTLSRRGTMRPQHALSCLPTETLLEDAQPYGSL
jgi:hypothetical protein